MIDARIAVMTAGFGDLGTVWTLLLVAAVVEAVLMLRKRKEGEE